MKMDAIVGKKSLSWVGVFLLVFAGSCIFLSFRMDAQESNPSENVDATVKKIAVNYLRDSFENAKSVQEIAESVGVDPEEVERVCIALNIPYQDSSIDNLFEPARPPEALSLQDVDIYPASIVAHERPERYCLLVSKTGHTLHLLEFTESGKKIIRSFECKTGKNLGDKQQEGDNKTPEGVFYFSRMLGRNDISRLVGSSNAYQYGDLAFTTDFPNAIDRIDGKNGSGIWLHGTDEPFDEKAPFDTRGCVVVSNETIRFLKDYIILYETPMVIVDEIHLDTTDSHELHKTKILELIDGWRSAWENEDLGSYIGYYDMSFASSSRSLEEYKQYKKTIFDAYSVHSIDLSHFSVLKHNETGVVVRFEQDYRASNLQTRGTKTLYFIRSGNSWKIVAEQFQS